MTNGNSERTLTNDHLSDYLEIIFNYFDKSNFSFINKKRSAI